MKVSSTKRGFTLTELLTVIAIIGLLAGLLFPAIKNSMLKAERNKAQIAISSALAHAFQAYYTEYGKWPIAYPATVTPPYPYEDFIVDKYLVALLSGDDVGGTSVTYPSPTVFKPTVLTGFGPPLSYGASPNAVIQGNPRKIVFLEFKNKELDTTAGITQGAFVDPWGKPYHFRLDVNYQNQVNYPFSTVVTPLTLRFLIWSVGPDGLYDQGDTIAATTPTLVVQSSSKNSDNVKSW